MSDVQNLLSTPEGKDYIKKILKEGIVEVVFTKVDGAERVMNCTLKEDIIPAINVEQTASTKKRQENDGVVRVWDLDKTSWRSFRWDSIKSFKFDI